MISRGRKKGTTRFAMSPGNGVKKVALAGDFNGWTPTTMRKQKDGTFVANLALSPGSYDYKFIMDGQWVVDPDNSAWAMNPFGTLNSVVHAK